MSEFKNHGATRRRWAFWAVLAIAPIGAGCQDQGETVDIASAEPAPIGVQTEPAHRVSVPQTLELDGTLAAYRAAKLSPLVAGHVSAVEVERGDVVKAGDALIVLRGKDLALAAASAWSRAEAQRSALGLAPGESFDAEQVPSVVAAKTDWKLAADEHQRTKTLFEAGTISQQAFDQAQAAAEAAEARYTSVKQQATGSYASYQALSAEAAVRADDADNATLRAPFEGAVVQRFVEIGEFVSPQQPVVELVDASKLRLELEVPERNVGSLEEGQRVEIRVDGTDERLEGTVEFMAAALDPDRRTLTIEVVADNPDRKVRAGHFARARIALGAARELIRVPSSAVMERAGVYRIYTVEEGRARARIVELIDKNDDGTSLIQGDVANALPIVTAPPAELGDGAPVSVE